MFNDLNDEQRIIIYAYIPMFQSVSEIYNGKVGNMPEDLHNMDKLKSADFYLLDGVEQADVIAIMH